MARTSGGLGKGFDALFSSGNDTKTIVQTAEERSAESARPEAERVVLGAEELATMQAETLQQTAPASTDVRMSSDTLADSIDVSFSLSEPEIVERAPRPAAPAPVEQAPTSSATVRETPATLPDGAIAELALEYIELNPYQPRLKFKQEPLDELAASIARDGLLQPITVRSLPGGRFQIISGERRFRAAQLAGLRSVPAYIRDANDREMGKFALVENLQREDLNPIEAAIGYRNLMKAQNLTQSDVAQLVCKGRSTIANTLRLLDLPEDLQEMIYNEQLTEGHARAIQQVPNAEGRKKLADRVIAEGLSVRATENLARLMSGKPAAEGAERTERVAVPAAFKAVARSLKQHLGTNVKVKNSGGKNKIEIEFADAEELERIVSQIVGTSAPAAGASEETAAEDVAAAVE